MNERTIVRRRLRMTETRMKREKQIFVISLNYLHSGQTVNWQLKRTCRARAKETAHTDKLPVIIIILRMNSKSACERERRMAMDVYVYLSLYSIVKHLHFAWMYMNILKLSYRPLAHYIQNNTVVAHIHIYTHTVQLLVNWILRKRDSNWLTYG